MNLRKTLGYPTLDYDPIDYCILWLDYKICKWFGHWECDGGLNAFDKPTKFCLRCCFSDDMKEWYF